MQTSPLGIELLEGFEALRLEAYPDPASRLARALRAANIPVSHYTKLAGWEKIAGDPWTIGWGHTGADVKPGLKIDHDEAVAFFKADLAGPEQAINSHVEVELSQNQFDALVSFIFNCGIGAFIKSTLLKRVNQGDFERASNEFLKFVYVDDGMVDGKPKHRVDDRLVNRRKKERAIFRGEHDGD